MPRKKEVRDELTKGFFIEYIANGGNATQAYLAVNPSVKLNTAKVRGSQIIREHPEMLEKVISDIAKANRDRVISVEGRMEWLTDVIMQRNSSVKCSVKDRLAALKELNRMDGFTSDEQKVKVTITPEEQKEAYKELLDNQFNVVDAEYDEKEDDAS